MQWYRRLGALLVLTGIAGLLLSGAAALAAQAALSSEVIRIHIVAASDAPEHQAQKLLVRDRILSELTALLSDCGDTTEAAAVLERALPDLTDAAQDTLRQIGCRDAVQVSLAVEPFPTRSYSGFSLPAGPYLALRLVIGDGRGQNWWCVAFPPLCMDAVSSSEELTALGLDERSAALAADGYTLRFRCVELWERLCPDQPMAT